MLPLENFRILDLTHVWAGPFCTRLLADMGAEVIKVEATRRPDLARGPRTVSPEARRGYPEDDPGADPWNRTPRINERNRNKLGVTLDLSAPRGRELLLQLVQVSDVLCESFSARVMEGLGLDYATLRHHRPDIVMLSMPGFGSTGPWRDFTSYGTTIEHLAGLVSLTGYGDEHYVKAGINLPDGLAAVHAAGALLAALYQRLHTGQGQLIDVSQLESTVALIGDKLLGVSMGGPQPAPQGNRNPRLAPQGCYPCKGQDAWVTLAVTTPAEWEGLCRALGQPELVADPRFAEEKARHANHDALDAIIAAWTSGRDKYEAAHHLQRHGVAAAPVLNARDQFGDPQFRARHMFALIDHPSAGPREYPGVLWKLSATSGQVRLPAPTLGQHNGAVLGGLLGVSDGELEELEGQGVIGTVPLR